MKTSELIDATLDWAVAKCAGYIDDCNTWLHEATIQDVAEGHFKPSSNWAQGGPIIEREGVSVIRCAYGWVANIDGLIPQYGITPLIAAMRCYVASKLGDEVAVPDLSAGR